MRNRLIAVSVIVSLTLAATACSPKPAATSTAPDAASSASQPATSWLVSANAPRAMTIAEKQKLIAPNFQIEVPVPFGQVVSGEAQGDTAWDYELIVDAPVAAVANWYEQSYEGREWQLSSQTVPKEGSLTLTLTKNSAQTRVTISPNNSGTSRVKGILGVGTPVLQGQ